MPGLSIDLDASAHAFSLSDLDVSTSLSLSLSHPPGVSSSTVKTCLLLCPPDRRTMWVHRGEDLQLILEFELVGPHGSIEEVQQFIDSLLPALRDAEVVRRSEVCRTF